MLDLRKNCHSFGKPKGGGLLNSLINNLPFEVHLPGYQFCGPGTKLDKRLARGEKGVNKLDSSCREHDIVYKNSNDLQTRHKADTILKKEALQRIGARDSSFSERVNGLLVGSMMAAKLKMGMGTNTNKKNMRERKKKKKKVTLRNVITHVNKQKCWSSPHSESSLEDRLKSAILVSKKFMKGKSKSDSTPRVIQVPKTGGILPLIPIFAGLSALGSLAGGVSTLVKNIKKIKENATLEKPGKVGDGIYLKKYKAGMGLYLKKYKGSGNSSYKIGTSLHLKKVNGEFTSKNF